MKKVKFFGLAGIILLASGAGFSSCSSDSADPTGGTGVAGQVVKTQFATLLSRLEIIGPEKARI